MTDTTCTDDDLARALDYARRLTASGVADAGTLLARALLRLEAELASARAALAEERIESSRRQSGIERLIADKAKLNSELDAITAALDGQPLPPDAGERARRVGDVRSAATAAERARWERRIIGVEVDSTSGPPYGVAALRLSAEPAPEGDGLTDEDRAKGWRWTYSAQSCVFTLRAPSGGSVAWVGTDGWETSGDARGPETGPAGQRAACAHLREAGVLKGG